MSEKRKKGSRLSLIIIIVLVLSLGSLWAGTQSFDKSASPDMGGGQPFYASRKTTAEPNDAIFMSASTDMALGGGYAAESAPAPEPSERKIVRTASLSLSSPEYDEALASLRALIDGAGGYVSNFYEYGDTVSGIARSATLSLRVPSGGLDAFITGAQGIARVTSRSESSTDMTTQYSDNETRLVTLRAKLQRLSELMLKAETTADLIELETAISDTQYEIERYESRQLTIDRDVDMSEVSVTLTEETAATSASAEDKSLGERLSAAISASLNGIAAFFRNMLVFLVMALPVIVPLALVIVIVAVISRRRTAKRAESASAEHMQAEVEKADN